jgi:hypothetical protein
MMAIEAVGGLEPIVTFFNPLSSPGGVTHIDDFTQISDILQRWQTKDAGVLPVTLGHTPVSHVLGNKGHAWLLA